MQLLNIYRFISNMLIYEKYSLNLTENQYSMLTYYEYTFIEAKL